MVHTCDLGTHLRSQVREAHSCNPSTEKDCSAFKASLDCTVSFVSTKQNSNKTKQNEIKQGLVIQLSVQKPWPKFNPELQKITK